MRDLRRSWWWTASLLLLTLSCAYSPDFENDKLQCGPANSCPKGYGCASDNRCWKSDQLPDKFLATWTFVSGMLTVTCSDGSTFNRQLATPPPADYIMVALGPSGLIASYYCNWNLRLPAGDDTAVVLQGQSCMTSDTDPATNLVSMDTWTANTFSFTTSDGKTATVVGKIGDSFRISNGAVGTCQIMFNGTLTKPVR
jgi:hypothetical protein